MNFTSKIFLREQESAVLEKRPKTAAAATTTTTAAAAVAAVAEATATEGAAPSLAIFITIFGRRKNPHFELIGYVLHDEIVAPIFRILLQAVVSGQEARYKICHPRISAEH